MILTFRVVALCWGLIVVVLSLLTKNRGLALILIITYGAFGILPENEINLFTRAMLFLSSLFLVMFQPKAPVKPELAKVPEEEAEEVPIYTREQAEQFNKLLEKSKEVHKNG